MCERPLQGGQSLLSKSLRTLAQRISSLTSTSSQQDSSKSLSSQASTDTHRFASLEAVCRELQLVAGLESSNLLVAVDFTKVRVCNTGSALHHKLHHTHSTRSPTHGLARPPLVAAASTRSTPPDSTPMRRRWPLCAPPSSRLMTTTSTPATDLVMVRTWLSMLRHVLHPHPPTNRTILCPPSHHQGQARLFLLG